MQANERTSGALMLQERQSKTLIGTVAVGLREDGRCYFNVTYVPKADTFSISTDRVLRVRRDLALDLVGIIHVLLAASGFLREHRMDRTDNVSRTMVFAHGMRRDVLELQLSEESILKSSVDADGVATAELSMVAAEQLAGLIAQELGRVAAWVRGGSEK